MPSVGSVNNTSDRNYLDAMNTDKKDRPNKVYNAVFSDKDSDDLSVSDFFDMMILQLTNQDFMNPVDDTQYLAQMAQFATMQEMMDLCQYSKQNYVTAMLGKEVTVSKNVIGGDKRDIVGKVEKITIQDGDYKVWVEGKAYDISKVVQISEPSQNTGAAGAAEKPEKGDEAVEDNNSDNADENTEAELLAASLLADG